MKKIVIKLLNLKIIIYFFIGFFINGMIIEVLNEVCEVKSSYSELGKM